LLEIVAMILVQMWSTTFEQLCGQPGYVAK